MSDHTLVKTSYLNEIAPITRSYKPGDSDPFIKKIKEWLMLWQFNDYKATVVLELNDEFDKDCEKLVKITQQFLSIKQTGVVNPAMWELLVSPLKRAMDLKTYNLQTPAERLVYFATRHVQYHAAELLEANIGPWVRAYVDGHEGELYYWCQAFACTLWDQCFSSFGVRFDKFYANTWACEIAREEARKSGYLRTHNDIIAGKYTPKPGDAALYIFEGDTKAHHTEIVYEVLDPYAGIMRTIGGNTNFGGDRSGVGVFMVDRNYKSSDDYKIDFITMVDLEEINKT